jgi:hypothetical protein
VPLRLVGSEMCIRDRFKPTAACSRANTQGLNSKKNNLVGSFWITPELSTEK